MRKYCQKCELCHITYRRHRWIYKQFDNGYNNGSKVFRICNNCNDKMSWKKYMNILISLLLWIMTLFNIIMIIGSSQNNKEIPYNNPIDYPSENEETGLHTTGLHCEKLKTIPCRFYNNFFKNRIPNVIND